VPQAGGLLRSAREVAGERLGRRRFNQLVKKIVFFSCL
jgi:hypothetical protein